MSSNICSALAGFFKDVSPNKRQFGLNVFITILIGASLKTTLVAQSKISKMEKFAVSSNARSLYNYIAFGFSKAVANLIVGISSDMYGKKRVMTIGWLLGLIHPILVITAASWSSVAWSNVFLGIQQGFCWSLCIFMMVDYAGPRYRGLAVGLNETVGYVALGVFNAAVPALFGDESGRNYQQQAEYLVLICFVVGMFLSVVFLRDTKALVTAEQKHRFDRTNTGWNESVVCTFPSGRTSTVSVFRFGFLETSFINPQLMVCCLAGLTINFLTTFAWGIGKSGEAFESFDDSTKSSMTLTYDVVKGLLQCVFGFYSDVIGRKKLVVGGLATCSFSLILWAIFSGAHTSLGTGKEPAFFFANFLLGIGTSMMYSPVIAAAAEHADPSWRASAIGSYRFWRDSGYAFAGLILGQVIEGSSVEVAIVATAVFSSVVALSFWRVFKEKKEEEIDMAAITLDSRDPAQESWNEPKGPGAQFSRVPEEEECLN